MLYCEQLESLKVALQVYRSERRKVRLLHDNVRANAAKVPTQKLEELGWEVLLHSPSSPDLPLSDYHLFRSLYNHLVTRRFDDETDLKSDLKVFFSSLSKKFFADRILNLSKRWQYVTDNDSVYVID